MGQVMTKSEMCDGLKLMIYRLHKVVQMSMAREMDSAAANALKDIHLLCCVLRELDTDPDIRNAN